MLEHPLRRDQQPPHVGCYNLDSEAVRPPLFVGHLIVHFVSGIRARNGDSLSPCLVHTPP